MASEVLPASTLQEGLLDPKANRLYTFHCFEYGYPTRPGGRRPQSQANVRGRDHPYLILQTGYYSFKFACDTVTLLGYDAVVGSDYLTALHQDVSVFTPAQLLLRVYKGETWYDCVSGSVHDSSGVYVRLIDSGQYVQRFDHTGLVFRNRVTGDLLDVAGRLEVTAWPDRVVLFLDFREASGVTRTTIRVISPSGTKHLRDTMQDHAVLALRPQDDARQTPLNVRSYIAEARNLQTGEALQTQFDTTTHGLTIHIPKTKVPYPESVDRVDDYRIVVMNPTDSAQNVPLIIATSTSAITGTVLVLCQDTDEKYPTGVPVQISKNWHRKPQEPTVHEGYWLRGWVMLRLGAKETRSFRLRVIYGYWGGVSAVSHAQLSLIGYGGNWQWDESALGCWGESMTYDPTQHLGSCFICDVRPTFVTPMCGGTHNWTNNSGGGDFLIYCDSNNVFRWATRLKTAYHLTGPNMTRVLYSGVTDDGKIKFTYTVRAVRTNDYHRRFHAYRYEFLEEVQSPVRLVFYQMAADFYRGPVVGKYYVGDGEGLLAEYPSEPGGNKYSGSAIPFEHHWLAVDDTIHDAKESTPCLSRRGLLSLNSTLNGAPFRTYLHPYGRSWGEDRILFDLSSESVRRSYSAGDVVAGELEFILPPRTPGDYWGADSAFASRLEGYAGNPWRAIADEFKYNAQLNVTVIQGTLVWNYPVEIQAPANPNPSAETDLTLPTVVLVVAEFVVSGGGLGHVPIVLHGVPDNGAFQVEFYLDGAWVPLESHAYQVARNAAGTAECIFNVVRPSTDLNAEWRIRATTTAS